MAEALDELGNPTGSLAPAMVVPFQNGVGSDEAFAHVFGGANVLSATLTSPVSLDAPSVVRLERARGGVGLAPFIHPTHASRQTLASLSGPLGPGALAFMNAPGLASELYADARALRWSKLLLNIVGNATSAILDKTVAEIYADPLWSKVELGMIRECVRVIDAQHIALVNLPGAPAAWLARAVRSLPNALLRGVLAQVFAKARGQKRPSLYYDVASHVGRSEVGWLNGAIADAGQTLGVPAPINRRLTDVLTTLVQPQSRLTRDEAMRQLSGCILA